ncbi:MAG: ABC transporter substrate-binding protein [Firmicutes bacterium]|nr:ABC transporter substrate-binding protein [Bacillota bacterium]
MKKLLTLVLTLSFVLLLGACDTNDNIKLGVIGPLTGDYSMYGVAVANGAKLAAAEINADGGVLGRDFEVIAYDSKGDPTEGVNAYNRLVDKDGIDALIGGTFSGVTLAIKELAIADNLPVLTPTATNPTVTLDAPNVFRACYTDSYQGTVAAVFSKNNLEATNAAVLYNSGDAYSEGLAEAFVAEFTAGGGTVTEYTFSASDDDFSAVLANIAASAAEVVFLPAYVAEVGAILTQADAAGMNIPFVGGDGWDGLEADYAAVAEGMYFGNHYAKSDTAQVVVDFVANYTEEYGEAPNALAALAYDAVYAMAEAMENAGTTDATELIAALTDLDFQNAVTGSIKFDENGDPIKAITIIQIVNGEHVVVDKVEGN